MMSPTARVALLVLCAGALFGHGITSIAGVLDTLRDRFALDLLATQLLVFSLVAACFVGALAAGPASLRWGRRPTLAAAALAATAAYALLLTAPSLTGVVIARLLAGLAIGVCSMVAPMYAGEAAQAARRGAVVALFQLAITGGILLSYLLAFWLDGPEDWPQVLGAGLLLALAVLIALALLPESPRWLAARGRADHAREAAHRLGLADEWQASAPAPAGPPPALGALLRQGRVIGVLVLCSALFILQNLSGIDGILYYAPQIFKNLGFSAGAAALGATVGLGLVNFIATLASVALVDRAGRRPLWIAGSALAAVGLAGTVAAAWLGWPWLGLGGLSLFILAFAISLGPLPYVLMAELFPSALREQGIAIASAVSWLFNALVALTFLSIVEALGLGGTMGLFMAVCLLSLGLGLWLLPETRHVPLEDIEARVLAGQPLRDLGQPRRPTAR